MIMQADDTVDWPVDTPIGKGMDMFQEDLLCPICASYYANPHILRCGHSFCSLCIRRHCDAALNRTSHSQCPSCREKVDLQDLRRNVVLGSIVDKYRGMSKELHSALFPPPISSELPKSALKSKDDMALKKRVRVVTPGKAITCRMAQYHFHGASKDTVKRAIEEVTKESKVKLRMDGSKDLLEKRLRELIHVMNAQLGAAQPLTLEEAVETINYQEKITEAEAQKCRMSTKASTEGHFRALTQKALQSKHKESGESSESSSSSSLQSWLSLQGVWRVALSTKLDRPFFFNTATQTGQFAVPEELRRLDLLEEEEGEEVLSQGDMVFTQYSREDQPDSKDNSSSSSSISEEPLLQLSPVICSSNSSEDLSVSAPEEAMQQQQLVQSQSQEQLEAGLEQQKAQEQEQEQEQQQAQEQEEQQAHEQEQQQLVAASQPDPMQWICEACTYINQSKSKRIASCEMCDTPNPAHSMLYSKPSRSQRSVPSSYNESALFRASISSSQLANMNMVTPQRKKQKRA